MDTFFIDKYLRKKGVEYDVTSPQPEGTSGGKVPTMKPAGTIVVKVVPPKHEGGGGNQFEQVNEPAVRAGAQPLVVNVVAQPVAANGITPYPDYVASADWPQNYKSIRFTPFSGEGSEDAATHISRFQSECGPYGNDPFLKLRVFGSSLAGSALTWYTKLVPGSIPDWATIERMFRMTFGTVKPKFDLSSFTSTYQQPTESPVEFLKRFKVQHAKCRSPVSEEDVVRIAIKGLEPRQRLKHHDGQFANMAYLMNKVGSYQIVLNDMDERQNTSSGTYTPRTLKPRFGPNQHRTVGAIYSHVDQYYPVLVAHQYSMDYDDEKEVAALELVSKKPARSQSLRLARSPLKISAAAFTKPQFPSYTYDANRVHDVLDDFFRKKLIKHDFVCVKLRDQIQAWINEGVVTLDEEKTVSLVDKNPFPTVAMVDVVPILKHKAKSKYELYTYNADLAHVLLDELIQANLLNIPWGAYPSEEQLAGKTYCKFHNARSHDTSECVQLKDQVQQWLNEGRLVIEEGYTKGPPEESDKDGDSGEWPREGKQETVPEASRVLLCSRCKVECGILISYNEFETAVKAVEAKDKHLPPKHYQPTSLTGLLKQAKVRFKFRDSNLYKRNAKAGTSAVGPTPEVQKDILTKPYIPPASRNIIKDDTWYIKERGKTVEISHTNIRNMQKRYGRAKRKLTSLEQGLIKPEDLRQTLEQLRRTVYRLTIKPYAPLKRNRWAEPLAPPRESAFKRLSSAPGSPKMRSVLERLGPVPVTKSASSSSGTKPVSSDAKEKRIKSDPTPKKGV
ncbi:hypothetical protein ACLB2K_004475 [Fragaria x ananassa]